MTPSSKTHLQRFMASVLPSRDSRVDNLSTRLLVPLNAPYGQFGRTVKPPPNGLSDRADNLSVRRIIGQKPTRQTGCSPSKTLIWQGHFEKAAPLGHNKTNLGRP
jgi:hypothetical protein